MFHWIIEVDVLHEDLELDAVLDCQVDVAGSQDCLVNAVDSPVA
jgi:hypothetical protein